MSNRPTRIIFVKFIPLPEIVTNNIDLRVELSFLGDETRLWDSLSSSIAKQQIVPKELFLRNFSGIHWNVRNEMLKVSLHYLRLHQQFGLGTRFHIPLVSRKDRTHQYGSRLSVSEEIQIYPSLFAEHRISINSSDGTSIPKSLLRTISIKFNQSSSSIRRAISLLLFRDERLIKSRFSNYFTIHINSNHIPPQRNVIDHKPLYLGVSKNPGGIVIDSSKVISRVLLDRLLYAATLSISQRVVVPALWISLQQNSAGQSTQLKSLFETLFVAHSPTHFTHSGKESLKLFPYSHQRMIYEEIQDILDLGDIHRNIESQLEDWFSTLPRLKSLAFIETRPPIHGRVRSILQRTRNKQPDYKFEPPLKTVMDYLVLAYLRDSRLVETEIQKYPFPSDRIGMRNAHRIFKGCKELERKREIKPNVRESDLTPVPGVLLQNLLRMNLIEMSSGKMTSAKGAFRITASSELTIGYLENFLFECDEEHIDNLIFEYGK